MCVIIHRDPKIEIPFDKLKSACIVNADGMGIAIPDRGKLEIRKIFNTKGNDPEQLAKLLEDAKDLDVYVHLRYRTKGSTDKDNVHPFGVLKKARHGMDLQFMHNGTLSDWGTKTDCDSKQFAKEFLQPISERFIKGIDPEKLIHDPVYIKILEKYAGSYSVFLLVDNFGNHRIVNYDQGKEFKGWWASNEYSFNRTHRDPPKTAHNNHSRHKDYYSPAYQDSWKDDKYWNTERDGVQTEEKKVVSLATVPPKKGNDNPGDTKPPFNDEIPFETEEKEVATAPVVDPTLPKRPRFIDLAKLSCLADICQFSYEDISELIDEYPEEAAVLIRDLVLELYDRDIAERDEEEANQEVA